MYNLITPTALMTFFWNAPSTLAVQLPKSDKSETSYLSQKQKQFHFAQISEIEVFLLLEFFDTNKSFGIDKIHPLLLKTAAFQIHRPLTFIFKQVETRSVETKFVTGKPICKRVTHSLTHSLRCRHSS